MDKVIKFRKDRKLNKKKYIYNNCSVRISYNYSYHNGYI